MTPTHYALEDILALMSPEGVTWVVVPDPDTDSIRLHMVYEVGSTTHLSSEIADLPACAVVARKAVSDLYTQLKKTCVEIEAL